RTKAGAVLLARATARPEVLEYLNANMQDADFRKACPRLVARLLARDVDAAALEDRQKIVDASLNANDPVCEAFQKLILDHAAAFVPWRERFADTQDSGRTSLLQEFCDLAAAAIDAIGAPKDDEIAAASGEADAKDEYSVLDAAWVQAIRPNYQIKEYQGRRGLSLEEGAGGVMSWLKGEDGTVDVGEARFSLYAPRDATYRLWARVWFDDKCGNSFGLWLDEQSFGDFSDSENRMREWHWLPLCASGGNELKLKRGFHAGRLQAWEDGVCIESFALLPAAADPEKMDLKPKVHWDPALPSSLSFSMPYQSQMRGTTQVVTVWVRRNSPALTTGAVHLRLPAPFILEDGAADRIVRFEEGSPLANATFKVKLPMDAIAGEGPLRAAYTDVSGKTVRGETILGAQFDWWTTGPLDPGDAANQRLSQVTTASDEELKKGWSRLPLKALDAYRRLNFEYAYGAIREKYIYLCADMKVSRNAEYLALLTADDTAAVYIDGKLAIEQPGGGPGEGRLVMTPVQIAAGTHRIFARVYQDAAENPEGEDKYRHTWNHCNVKFLLRKQRHEPADAIQCLPHGGETPK
ncbi:MAG: hypothetical protein HY291_21355, partial [Planctomycetes bacterium]|nr:hypothetical protein [Planctomycetota bacterium]